VAPLSGFRIGVTAHRRAEEQAELLRRRGADVLLAPVVCTRPFDDDRRLRDATDVLLSRPPDLVVATTGIGIRSWFAATESWGIDGALRATLGSARIVARGPKAAAALLGVGVPSTDNEPSERLDCLVDRLVAEGINGQRIALQLYGEDVPWAVDRLTSAGAEVISVPVYTWTTADSLGPAHQLLDQVVTGQLDAVTFTSAAAVRTLADLADRAGIGAELRAALSSTALAACVGPITDEAATAVGFQERCTPQRGRLGLMVRVLARDLHARHRHLRAGDTEFVLHGTVVWTSKEQIALTDAERALLAVLAERPGAVVSRTALRHRVWADNCNDPTVDQGISRLRKTLRPIGLSVDVVTRRGWSVRATETGCPVVADAGPLAS
jgi:uroporphyrinogen-III synthase